MYSDLQYFSVTSLTFLLLSYAKVSPATDVMVDCDVATTGVCTVNNEVELLNCDNLKFYIDDAESIKELIFRHRTKFESIPYGIFTTFHELKILRIEQHNIRILESGRLQGARKLITLYLHHNEISNIPDYIFDGMVSLRTLHLSHNHIRRIPRFAFAGAPNIKALYLDGNNIETIEEGSLSPYSLEILDLRENNIKVLVLLNLPKLTTLNLSFNKLKLLNESLLNGLPSLKKLSVSMNGITHITNIFSRNKQLEELDLSRNNIDAIEEGAMKLKNLKYLDLKDNKLKLLSKLNLPKLLNLNLSLNKLKQLNDSILNGFPRLKMLNLSMNRIRHIGNVFNDKSKLRKLDLSANNIEIIAEGSFNLPKLIDLDLGWNKIKFLNDTMLNGMRCLRSINLERNNISYVENIFSGMNDLVELNLSGNNIENENFTLFAKLDNLYQLFGYKFPLEMENTPNVPFNLKKISLDGNFVSDPDIFKHLSIFPQLEELNANSNQFVRLNYVNDIREYLPKIKIINLIDNTPSLCQWIYDNKKGLESITVYGSTKSEICSNVDM